MNNARRSEISAKVDAIRAALSELESIRHAEQEAFDNMPEGLQQSEKGAAGDEAVSNLESAISSLEEACDYLESAAA